MVVAKPQAATGLAFLNTIVSSHKKREPFADLDINSPIKLRPRPLPQTGGLPLKKQRLFELPPPPSLRVFTRANRQQQAQQPHDGDDKENVVPSRRKVIADKPQQPAAEPQKAPEPLYEPTAEEKEFLRELFAKYPIRKDSAAAPRKASAASSGRSGARVARVPSAPARQQRPQQQQRQQQQGLHAGDSLASTQLRHFPLDAGQFGFGATEQAEGLFTYNLRWRKEFPLWDRYLEHGFHPVLWGWGSKVPLVEQFYRREGFCGQSHSVVVVPGYLPDCTGARVLDALCEFVACRTGLLSPKQSALQIDFLEANILAAVKGPCAPASALFGPRLSRGGIFTQYSAQPEAQLLLVVYTYDQPAYRVDETFQQTLTALGRCPRGGVCMLMTLDRAPAPEHYLFGPELDTLPWMGMHTPTFVPYKHLEAAEACRVRPFTIPRDTALMPPRGAGAPAAAAATPGSSTAPAGLFDEVVACNTTAQTRKVLRIALAHWKERKEDIPLAELLSRSMQILAAHDERGLLHQLQECLDHDVVSVVTGPSGDRVVHLIQPDQLERSLAACKG